MFVCGSLGASVGLSNYGFVPSTPASYASDEESEERFAFHLLVVTVALDDVLALEPMPAPSGANKNNGGDGATTVTRQLGAPSVLKAAVWGLDDVGEHPLEVGR